MRFLRRAMLNPAWPNTHIVHAYHCDDDGVLKVRLNDAADP